MNKAGRPIALDYRPAEAGRGVPMRSRSKHRLSVVCAAICCTLSVAACGSSSKPKSASTGGSGSMLKFSECMRSHGVSGFPDPSTSQGQNAIGIDGYDFNLPSTLNPQVTRLRVRSEDLRQPDRRWKRPSPWLFARQSETSGAGSRRVHAPARRPRLPRPESQRELSGHHSQLWRPGNRPSITRLPKGPKDLPAQMTVPSHEPDHI